MVSDPKIKMKKLLDYLDAQSDYSFIAEFFDYMTKNINEAEILRIHLLKWKPDIEKMCGIKMNYGVE